MRHAPECDGSKPPREAASLVRFAGLVIDLDASMLARESGEAIPLTRGEFALLRAFVARPGRVVSRDTLLDALTKRRFEPFDRSVDVLVGRLRRKIEPNPKQPCVIVTVPGEGYRFDGLTKGSISRELSITGLTPQNDEGREHKSAAAEPKPTPQAAPVPGLRFEDDQPVGRLRVCGQDGRGESRLGRSPPSQSRNHGQMDEGTHPASSCGVWRPRKGGAPRAVTVPLASGARGLCDHQAAASDRFPQLRRPRRRCPLHVNTVEKLRNLATAKISFSRTSRHLGR
jgi:DNA-binding winged helix-turn-helix (wHTH) protein